MCCVITRSLLKHTDLDITEFCQKSYYLLKIVHLQVYHKIHLIKKQVMKYRIILLEVHFNLRYSKLK